jgi:hypothetical protein
MALPDWVTEELLDLLGPLTPKQRQGIIRIVEADLAGESVVSLFRGSNRICAESTYYRAKPPGWHRQEGFQAALKAARETAWAFSMQHAVQDAMQILTVSAPEAARELQRQIRAGEKDVDKRTAANSVLDRLDRTAPRQVEVFDVERWKQDRQSRLSTVLEMEDIGEAEAEGEAECATPDA